MALTVEQIYNYFLIGLDDCNITLLDATDEAIDGILHDDLYDCNIILFMCSTSLNSLIEHNYINPQIAEKCSQLYEMYYVVMKDAAEYNIQAVRTSKKWRAMMEIGEEVRLLIRQHNAKPTKL